jgi:hypothetical protein
MDNESSSPQLLFPNVPDDFCPSGNWQEVLQQFIDTVLNNGTINVPGLGDVTPQQIQQINGQLASQQNEISALDVRVDAVEAGIAALPNIQVRTGLLSVSAGAGPTSYNVTFAALPGTNYGVTFVPVGTATTRANMGSYVLQSGQTTTGFTVIVNDNTATVTQLRWTAIYTS